MSRALPFALLLALPFGGCGEPLPGAGPDLGSPDTKALSRFHDCAELRGWVADAWTEALVMAAYGYGWGWGWGMGGAEDTADGDAGSDAGGAAPADWSETNVQEEGVDEPDIVKTDGDYLYVVQPWPAELTVVDAWPAQDAARVAGLALDGQPLSMFLEGDRAAVFASVWDDRILPDTGFRDGYGTRISLVDVRDRAHPVETRQIDVEGWYVDARRVGTDVYVVLQSWTYAPQEVWDLLGPTGPTLPTLDPNATEAERERVLAEARAILRPRVGAIVDAMGEDAFLPRVFDHAPDEVVAGEPLLACTDLYHPAELSDPAVLAVVHFDLGTLSPQVSATGLLASGWTVYASTDHLYVAQASWAWWSGWEDVDLSTQIHRFVLEGTNTVYEASGDVDGWLLSRWATSEWGGYLRVATTDMGGWVAVDDAEGDVGEVPAEPANNVFVLDRSLKVVGELRGIAPNEQIYAARYMGDVGFLVTYQQIDPLFTLDLSNPTAPALVGELEVPGYSSYLHPAGPDRLLAVGMDGDASGRVTGFQASLYDISDLSAPVQVDRLTVAGDDWSWSEALWDAHAFTYYDNVLSVPVYTYAYDYGTGAGSGFSGLWVVDVDLAAGLEELGRVDHADIVAESECRYGEVWSEDGTVTSGGACPDDYWWANMRRSVVIEDKLYSISDYGIKVNQHRDPSVEYARVLFWPLDDGTPTDPIDPPDPTDPTDTGASPPVDTAPPETE